MFCFIIMLVQVGRCRPARLPESPARLLTDDIYNKMDKHHLTNAVFYYHSKTIITCSESINGQLTPARRNKLLAFDYAFSVVAWYSEQNTTRQR